MKDRIGSLCEGADVKDDESRREEPAGTSEAAAGLEAVAPSLASSSRRMSRLEARRLQEGKPMPVEEEAIAYLQPSGAAARPAEGWCTDSHPRTPCADTGWYVDEEDCRSASVDNRYNDSDIACSEVGGE